MPNRQVADVKFLCTELVTQELSVPCPVTTEN